MARAKGTGSIFKPKGSSFYWIAYVSNGKRQYESSKSAVKQDAKDLLLERLSAIQHGAVVTSKMGRKTLGEGLKAVIDDLKMNGRKAIADAQRRIDLHLLTYFTADRRMSSITTGDIERYKAHRVEQKAASATVNRELAALRRAFRLAMRAGELVAMPYVGLLAEHNVRTGFLERDQFDAILKLLPAELHAPLKFAYATGWRFKSEVLPLTVDRVDLKAGVVRLDPGTTKSGQGRSFYVTEELRAVLQAQLDSLDSLKERGTICPYVFHRADGSPIKDFRKTWHTACEAAGYPGSCSMISDAPPSATLNARACRARPRCKWSGTKPSPSIVGTRSWTRRCTARRLNCLTCGPLSRKRKPSPSERDRSGRLRKQVRVSKRR